MLILFVGGLLRYGIEFIFYSLDGFGDFIIIELYLVGYLVFKGV